MYNIIFNLNNRIIICILIINLKEKIIKSRFKIEWGVKIEKKNVKRTKPKSEYLL